MIIDFLGEDVWKIRNYNEVPTSISQFAYFLIYLVIAIYLSKTILLFSCLARHLIFIIIEINIVELNLK